MCVVYAEGYDLCIFIWVTVSAQGQVVCRNTSDCSDASDLGLMTAEECCVNTPNALGFSDGEFCSPCVGECTIP